MLDFDLSISNLTAQNVLKTLKNFKKKNNYNAVLNIFFNNDSEKKVYKLVEGGLDLMKIARFFGLRGSNININKNLLNAF